MATRRRLSEQDKALWDRVVAEAKPLNSQLDAKAERPVPALSNRPPGHLKPSRDLMRPSKPTPTTAPASKAWLSLDDSAPRIMGKPEPGLDRRTAEKVRKGNRAPDARLDLHGMQSERAHQALNRFIGQSIGQQLRFVLVITGKGGRHKVDDAPFMRPGQGILRQAVPRWLRSGPHAVNILGVYEAHPRHGGSGALYVYLKRRR